MKLKFGTLIPFAICLCIKQIIALNGQQSNQNELFSMPDNSLSTKRIVCYLRSWAVGFDIENDMDPNICTHIIYASVKFDDNGTIADYSGAKG